MVRMHALDLMVDLFGRSHRSRSHGELQRAMKKIAEAGTGVIASREASSSSLSEMVNKQARAASDAQIPELRDYGVGAQILNDLNITNMVLLTNSKPNVIGLEGYGLHIDGWQPVSDVTEEHKG